MKPEKNIQLTKGEKFILIVYGIMAFCSLLLLFKPQCTHDEMQMQFEKAQSEMLLQNAQKQKADYEKQIVRLEKSNFVLKKLLNRADAELGKADSRNDFLKRKIHAYSDSVQLDSLENQVNCDSLRTYSLEFITTSERRDSICDRQVFYLHQIAENRDSAFFSCDRTLEKTDSLFQVLAQRHTQLADQLLLTQKNLRKSKRNTRIWSGASLLLSGITITLWMKNQ